MQICQYWWINKKSKTKKSCNVSSIYQTMISLMFTIETFGRVWKIFSKLTVGSWEEYYLSVCCAHFKANAKQFPNIFTANFETNLSSRST